MADRVLIRGLVCATTLLLGCGGPSGGTVSLVLDIPNSMLDPKGFSNVEVRLHRPDGDTEINVAVAADGTFDLGAIDVTPDVMIEASLRTDSGAAVGYGRGAVPVTLRDKEMITIPVRRPIVYFSGLFSEDNNPGGAVSRTWTKRKPTFYDLSSTVAFDGSPELQTNAVFTVSAGANLFVIDQMPTNPSDTLVLTGAPSIRSVSTVDHSVSTAPLSAILDGAVLDAAGSDDGTLLVIGTSTHLFVVDTESGMARPIADGSFSRVAIVSAGGHAVTAVAIRNRSFTGACTADLVYAAASADDTNQVMTLGTSGYTDVAADDGRGFYVDSCKTGELGEASATGVQSLRTALGRPGALAVSNGQAWVGIEKPTGVSVRSYPLASSDEPRTVFDNIATQVVEATDYDGVLRRLDAQTLQFQHLEVGAGGDYVAWSLGATYHGDAIPDVFFPEMDMQTEELRVLDVSTGAIIQNYRSTCEGTILSSGFDISNWSCSLSPGQIEGATIDQDKRINSLTFQFGKK